MKIIDNVLPIKDFNNIKNTLIGNNFPWYFYNGINVENDGHCQFSHIFYANQQPLSDYYQFINLFFRHLNVAALLRVKANLLLKTTEIVRHGMHIDTDLACKVAIFYVNTNNGYTGFEDGTKVHSQENRLVIFDSTQLHYGTTCTDENTRVIVNFNYFENVFF